MIKVTTEQEALGSKIKTENLGGVSPHYMLRARNKEFQLWTSHLIQLSMRLKKIKSFAVGRGVKL